MFCRFVEENGCNTAFVISGDAYDQFMALEQWRIYTMTLTGKVVRKSEGLTKFGIANTKQVHLKYKCQELSLSPSAWPLKIPYEFVSWDDLNQVSGHAFFDLFGEALSKSEQDMSSRIPKAIVLVGFGSFKQEVVLLGQHAGVTIDEGDSLAFAGLRMDEYKNRRTPSTAFLTVLELNPESRDCFPSLPEVDEDEPKRKAVRLSGSLPVAVSEAHRILDRMLLDAQRGVTPADTDFTLVGKLKPLEVSFFDDDAPVTGDEGQEKVCLSAILYDSSGEVRLCNFSFSFRTSVSLRFSCRIT